ncbi:MAG: B12-binding domain-containing radical SAM protein [Candidatus Omnitrophica bacterium]|nr:B12-binding domain-containing radical SAM protein [Candidatus Omnitrophota bacterium]
MKNKITNSKEKFKVLFVYPNLMLQTTFPLAISILSALLKQNGYDVDIFDTTFYKTEEIASDEYRVKNLQIAKFTLGPEFRNLKDKKQMFIDFTTKIQEYKPNLIAFSVLEDLYPLALELINISSRFKIPTIVGGLFPTFAPEKVIANEGIDIICIGDGEEAILELCDSLSSGSDYTRILNLWVKKEGEVFKNPIRAPRDINLNPPPDFLLFDERRFYRPMKGRVYRMGLVETNRGCVYTCSYCNSYGQTKIYKERIGKKYFRIKDIGIIHDEIKILVEKYKVEFIYFTAEVLLLMNKNYMKDFVRMYKKFNLPFFCQNRAEVINEETANCLVEMNCHSCSLGIEHGNEEFRAKVLNRKVSNQTYLDAVRCLQKTNITISVNNIVGFPDETRELVFDSISLNRKFKVFQINAYYFTPYHGTELRKYCLEKGYIKEDTQTSYITKDTILNMPTLSAEEIRGLVRTFTLYA